MLRNIANQISHQKVFKIIVVGDTNVGKTSLTYRFCEGKFLESAEATIGVDFREKTVHIDGEDVKLQFWDTAGQERFRETMVQHYYRNVHAVVIVYDVTRKSSFLSLSHWVNECNKHLEKQDVPKILVGNKCDYEGIQEVNTNLAQRFADFHNMPLFETSARLNSEFDHIEAIFLTLAHKLRSEKPFMLARTGSVLDSRVVTIDSADPSNANAESGCVYRKFL